MMSKSIVARPSTSHLTCAGMRTVCVSLGRWRSMTRRLHMGWGHTAKSVNQVEMQRLQACCQAVLSDILLAGTGNACELHFRQGQGQLGFFRLKIVRPVFLPALTVHLYLIRVFMCARFFRLFRLTVCVFRVYVFVCARTGTVECTACPSGSYKATSGTGNCTGNSV